jgi:hypothetical protein
MKRFLTGAALITVGVITGCRLFNPRDGFDAMDGNAGLVTSETVSMGEAAGELLGGQTLAKTEKTAADTKYVDIVISGWDYDDQNACWTRKSEAVFDNGTRVREDTVWLVDVNGAPVRAPSFATVARYRHVREVSRKFANTFNNRLDMNVQIDISGGDTVFVKNGTVTGTFNGDTYKTITITNVRRRWHRGRVPHLSWPYEGTVYMDLPLRTIDVVFNGNGTDAYGATATATRKRDGETIVYIINVQTGAEIES